MFHYRTLLDLNQGQAGRTVILVLFSQLLIADCFVLFLTAETKFEPSFVNVTVIIYFSAVWFDNIDSAVFETSGVVSVMLLTRLRSLATSRTPSLPAPCNFRKVSVPACGLHPRIKAPLTSVIRSVAAAFRENWASKSSIDKFWQSSATRA